MLRISWIAIVLLSSSSDSHISHVEHAESVVCSLTHTHTHTQACALTYSHTHFIVVAFLFLMFLFMWLISVTWPVFIRPGKQLLMYLMKHLFDLFN